MYLYVVELDQIYTNISNDLGGLCKIASELHSDLDEHFQKGRLSLPVVNRLPYIRYHFGQMLPRLVHTDEIVVTFDYPEHRLQGILLQHANGQRFEGSFQFSHYCLHELVQIMTHFIVIQVEQRLHDGFGELQAEREQFRCDFTGRFDRIQISAHVVKQQFHESSELIGDGII
jgi:hypothetical protein